MNFQYTLAFLAFGASTSIAFVGCDGGVDTTTSSASGGTGGGGQGGGGGQNPGCAPSAAISYEACSGTTFFPTGACADGSCATQDPAAKVYAAWKAKVLSLSGMTEQELAQRVMISTVESSPPFVEVDYIVVLDWVRSRQSDPVDLGGASSPPTDPEVQSAVTLAVEEAEWTSLGSIASVAPEAKVRAAFDSCECGIEPDWCHIDFTNVSGALTVRGYKEKNAAANECLEARVNVVTGELVSCDPTPCEIN